MKNYNFTLLLLCGLLFFACNRDDDDTTSIPTEETPPQKTALEFANLKIGNYWVYEKYSIDADGTESLMPGIDSMYIAGDTIIEDRSYLILMDRVFIRGPELLFDSAMTIFTFPERKALFSLDEDFVFNSEFSNQGNAFAELIFQLQDTVTNISVPAGDFNCVNFQGTINSLEPDYEHGVRISNKFYAEDVGLIMNREPFYSSPTSLEARLVRYGSN